MDDVDLRLAPVAASAWTGAFFATGASPTPTSVNAVVVTALLLAAGASVVKRWVLVGAFAALAVAAMIGGLRVHHLDVEQLHELASKKAFVSANVTVVAEPNSLNLGVGRRANRTNVVVSSVEGRQMVVSASRPAQVFATGLGADAMVKVAPGSTLTIQGRANLPRPGSRNGIEFHVRDAPILVSKPSAFDAGINAIRAGLVTSMSASPNDQAALVPSLVVGDTSRVSDQVLEQFKVTALTHLMAVSGANLTLLLGFIVLVAKWVGIQGWWVRTVSLAGIAAFVVLCRAEPSVLRAAAMGTVSLVALGNGRGDRRGIRHLCVAIIALVIIDPWLARSWGFSLSVAASLGIIWWANTWRAAMTWAPAWLAEAICVPLAAQVATAPLIVALSGQLSVVGVVANAIVGPFVGPATLIGVVAAILSVVFLPVATIAGWLAGWCVAPILWIAGIGAALPGAAINVDRRPVALAAFTLACLIVGRLIVALLRSPWWSVTMLIATIVISAWQPVRFGWPGTWKIAACYVGQGDATVLNAGQGHAVLIDTGPAEGNVLGCLRELGVTTIPLVILTHYHADHVGQLKEVLDHYSVGLTLISGLASPKPVADMVERACREHQVPRRTTHVGERIVVGDVTWTTVYPAIPRKDSLVNHDKAHESMVENDHSIIGVADVGGLSITLAGDADLAGQSAALREVAKGASLRADILKLPHHGASRQDRAFFQASGASVALVSAGHNNDYGHPKPQTLRLAASLNMQVIRTDTQGSLAIDMVEHQVVVRERGH